MIELLFSGNLTTVYILVGYFIRKRTIMRLKKIIITGGCGDIGFATGKFFQSKGFEVVLTGINEEEINSRPIIENISYEILDVTSDESAQELISKHNNFNVLVNAAGIVMREREFEIKYFSHVVDVHLNGTYRMCAKSVDILSKNKGSIVNFSSMLAFFGGTLSPAYSSAKGGISQLTKSLAINYASKNVRVNAVAPGWIATKMTDTLRSSKFPEREKEILGRTPMKRWGEPEDIAGPIYFLSSEELAGFVTGVILPIDGGYLAYP